MTDAQSEGNPVWDNGEAIDFENWGMCNWESSCVPNAEEFDHVIIDLSNNAWSFTLDEEFYYIIEMDCGTPYQPKADLAIDSIGGTISLLVQHGEQLNIEYKLYNKGSAQANDYEIKIFLSEDHTLDDADFLIHTTSHNSTSAGFETSVSTTVTIPSNIPYDEYTIIIIADEGGTVEEIDEENNHLYVTMTPSFRVVGAQADLVISDIDNFPETANQNETVTFDFDLNNIGVSPVQGDYQIDFYLSKVILQRDLTTPNDLEGGVLVGSIVSGNNGVGTTEDVTGAIGIPDQLPFGRYQIYSFIDSQNNIDEISESNNSGFYYSSTSNSTINEFIEIRGDYGPDLEVTITSQIPANLDEGDQVVFDYTVTNQGGEDAYISEDNQTNLIRYRLLNIPSGGQLYGSGISIPRLAPGETFEGTGTINIRYVDSGTKYILVEVNGNTDAFDADETNNFASHLLQVDPVEAADLRISNVLNVPDTVIRGEVFNINFDLINRGEITAAGNYSIGIYLNESPYFSGGIPNSAFLSGLVSTGNTAVDTIPDILGAITIPEDIPMGTYYLEVYADAFNDIPEIAENNNNGLSFLKIVVLQDFETELICPNDIQINIPYGATSVSVNWDDELSDFAISNNCIVDLAEILLSQTGGICNGSFFSEGIHDMIYTAQGDCNDGPFVESCTFQISIDQLTQDTVYQNESLEICEGDSINGTNYLVDTIVLDTIVSGNEITFVTNNIIVHQGFDSTIYILTCDSTLVGTDSQIFTNSFGCDSVLTWITSLQNNPITFIDESLCQGEIYDFNGTQITTTGSYTDVMALQNGCDSLTTLDIEFNPVYFNSDTFYVELGETWMNILIENDTTIVEELMSSNGCDSIIYNIILIDMETNTTELNRNQFDVLIYPNPSFAEINLEIKNVETHSLRSINIYSASGQLQQYISEQELVVSEKTFKIIIREIPKGIHFIEVQTEEGNIVKKIVKL